MADQQNPIPINAAQQEKDREFPGSKHDPQQAGAGSEEHHAKDEHELRERALDKTLEDSFPTSDPPSSIPDPVADESDAA